MHFIDVYWEEIKEHHILIRRDKYILILQSRNNMGKEIV